MRIIVKLDPDELCLSLAQGNSLVFPIYWEHDGAFWPGEHWYDFGVIVLGWWLDEATRILSRGAPTRFRLMDGSAVLFGRYDQSRDLVRFSAYGLQPDWEVSPAAVLEAMIQAYQDLSDGLAALGVQWALSDPVALKLMLCDLR